MFLVVAVFVLVAGVAAFILLRTGSKNPAPVTGPVTAGPDKTATSPAPVTATTGAKQDNRGNYEPPADTGQESPAPGLPADVSQLKRLAASVTAVQSVSDDSISISFYVQGPGHFTVEEQQPAGDWQAVRENVYYPGTGGLAAVNLPPAQQTATVRLLGISDGQYTSVTGAVTVSRPEVVAAGGIKTYNTG